MHFKSHTDRAGGWSKGWGVGSGGRVKDDQEVFSLRLQVSSRAVF